VKARSFSSLVSIALLAWVAGCGVVSVPGRVVDTGAVQARAAIFDYKGISADGRLVSSYSMFDGYAVRLRAEVSNPGGGALNFKWNAPGSYLELPDGGGLSWFGRTGRHTISCTVSDTSGRVETRQVVIQVWPSPTPAPFPPNPFPPIPPRP